MLHSITGKDFYSAVVHADRKANNKRALGELQAFTEVGIEAHGLRGFVELCDCETKSMGIELLHTPPINYLTDVPR